MNLRKVTPGALVNREFGPGAIADHLGLTRSAVWRWRKDAPVGTGGFIPWRYHADLLRLAHRLNVPLTAEDLVLGRHK